MEIKKADESVPCNWDDVDGKYGEYVAMQLRKIDDDIVKHRIKMDIENIFLSARMGMYITPQPMYIQHQPNTQLLGLHQPNLLQHTDYEQSTNANPPTLSASIGDGLNCLASAAVYGANLK